MDQFNQVSGTVPYFTDDYSGTYNVRDIQVTGLQKPADDRIFYTDLSLTVAAGNSVTGNLLTFTNCVGFKIKQLQAWAYKVTSANVYGAVDLVQFTMGGVSSGQSYPTATRSYGTGTTGYNSFFRIAQDPDFHQLSFDGPIYVQQGQTFTIDYVVYSTFALNDVVKAGVTITWQEL